MFNGSCGKDRGVNLLKDWLASWLQSYSSAGVLRSCNSHVTCSWNAIEAGNKDVRRRFPRPVSSGRWCRSNQACPLSPLVDLPRSHLGFRPLCASSAFHRTALDPVANITNLWGIYTTFAHPYPGIAAENDHWPVWRLPQKCVGVDSSEALGWRGNTALNVRSSLSPDHVMQTRTDRLSQELVHSQVVAVRFKKQGDFTSYQWKCILAYLAYWTLRTKNMRYLVCGSTKIECTSPVSARSTSPIGKRKWKAKRGQNLWSMLVFSIAPILTLTNFSLVAPLEMAATLFLLCQKKVSWNQQHANTNYKKAIRIQNVVNPMPQGLPLRDGLLTRKNGNSADGLCFWVCRITSHLTWLHSNNQSWQKIIPIESL